MICLLYNKTDGRMKTAQHASRFSSLLHLEVNQARVSQSSLNIGGGTTRMVHVASSWGSRRDEAEDGRVDAMGCIGLFYPNFVVFIVLGHKGSLVISFSINRTQGLVERIKHATIHLPPPSHSFFLRGVGVLHGVREERRESERSL
jgi:hypothetical protein